jgi:hypothetical protein
MFKSSEIESFIFKTGLYDPIIGLNIFIGIFKLKFDDLNFIPYFTDERRGGGIDSCHVWTFKADSVRKQLNYYSDLRDCAGLGRGGTCGRIGMTQSEANSAIHALESIWGFSILNQVWSTEDTLRNTEAERDRYCTNGIPIPSPFGRYSGGGFGGGGGGAW